MKLNSKETKIWLTSDLHFGHKSIIDFCPNTRPYICTEQMNLDIVETWNSQVGENDIVFILGDVSFAKKDVAEYLFSLLKGKKIIVAFNPTKAKCLTARGEPSWNTTYILQWPHGTNKGGYRGLDGKTPTLTTSSGESNNYLLHNGLVRKLSPYGMRKTANCSRRLH